MRFESPEYPFKLLFRAILPSEIWNETWCEIGFQNMVIDHIVSCLLVCLKKNKQSWLIFEICRDCLCVFCIFTLSNKKCLVFDAGLFNYNLHEFMILCTSPYIMLYYYIMLKNKSIQLVHHLKKITKSITYLC